MKMRQTSPNLTFQQNQDIPMPGQSDSGIGTEISSMFTLSLTGLLGVLSENNSNAT